MGGRKRSVSTVSLRHNFGELRDIQLSTCVAVPFMSGYRLLCLHGGHHLHQRTCDKLRR